MIIGFYEPKNSFSDEIPLLFTDLRTQSDRENNNVSMACFLEKCLYLFEGFKIEILLQKMI